MFLLFDFLQSITNSFFLTGYINGSNTFPMPLDEGEEDDEPASFFSSSTFASDGKKAQEAESPVFPGEPPAGKDGGLCTPV